MQSGREDAIGRVGSVVEEAATRRRNALAAGEQDLTDCYAALCRRPVQWVIQSVGRRQRTAGSEGFTRAGASARIASVIYSPPPWNVANLRCNRLIRQFVLAFYRIHAAE